MTEIWQETQHQIRKLDKNYKKSNLGFIIGVWWFLWLVNGILDRYAFKSALKADTIEQLIDSDYSTIYSEIASIICSLVVVLLIYLIVKMENKLAFEIKNNGGEVLQK